MIIGYWVFIECWELKIGYLLDSMRAVIQRVKKARVKVDGKIVGEIGQGLLVLLAVHQDDKEEAIKKMAEKIINLRIFGDENDKMNLSVKDIDGEILVVSQFTLYGDCRKGNRPSFIESAKPEKAISMYEKFVKYIKGQGIHSFKSSKAGVKQFNGVKVETGEFGAQMSVELVNDGPVTIIINL